MDKICENFFQRTATFRTFCILIDEFLQNKKLTVCVMEKSNINVCRNMKNRIVVFVNLLTVILLCAISCGGQKANTTGKITMDEIRNTDLSHQLFMPDSILKEPDYNPKTEEFIYNENVIESRWFEPIGFRSNVCQRFYIHYDSVYHKGNGVYAVEGRTRYRDTIRLFSGTLTLDSLWLHEGDCPTKNGEFGRLYGHYMYEEDEFSGGGILSGKMSIDFAKINGRFYYDAVMLSCADGYDNNQYEGTWSSRNLSRMEKCNWGDFRIPDSEHLDTGTGMFIPHEECFDRGWRIYTYNYADNNSLKALFQADEQWFTHEEDYIIPYSGRLQRYLTKYGRSNKRPAAKVLLATIPTTQEEYTTWYEIGSPADAQQNYLWPPMSDYAHADSTDIMFAYMRMGEFSDGEISEGLFDDYIELQKEHPALFAKYRKLLSKQWNETFDWWKKEMYRE